MIDNTKKRLIIFLLLFIVGTLAGIFGYLNAKITTFEECEKAGWLVRSITMYDGYIPVEKECVLWSGKSFVKEISPEEQRAVEIAIAHLSYPVTIIEVKKLECQGCFSVKLQISDNQHQSTIVLDNWKIKNVVQSDNVNTLPAPFFPTQKEPATSYMAALLSDKPEELIIKDGCLRAGGYLLVWPYGFSLTTDKDGIFQVIDSTGQPVARVGDKVRIGGGGGEMSGGNSGDITKYSEELPSRCSGPYWIVGEVITVDKSTSPVAATPTLKSAPSQYFSGQTFDEAAGILTKNWDAENFAGFWRDAETGASTETLVINQSILNNSYRRIEKHNLIYSTKSIPVKYQVYARANKTPPNTNGFYSSIGWLGEKYVLLEGSRLARIIFEQNDADVKTMHTRESWNLGNGYKIAANSIGVPLRGEEQAWIAFFKDNTILEDKVLPNNSLYSYLETANGAPVFVTYTSNIYRLPQEDVADFKYTWLRSQNVTEIKEGGIFGAMEVTSVKNGIIELRNKEPIDLAPDTVINLIGDISILVGDSKTGLLFYPTKGEL